MQMIDQVVDVEWFGEQVGWVVDGFVKKVTVVNKGSATLSNQGATRPCRLKCPTMTRNLELDMFNHRKSFQRLILETSKWK